MKHRGIIIGSLGMVLLLVNAAIFFQMKNVENLGNDILRPVSGDVRVVGEEDFPDPIENEGKGGRVWSLRDKARKTQFDEVFIAAIQFVRNAPIIIARHFEEGSASDNWLYAEFGIKFPHAPSPLIKPDGSLATKLFASAQEAGWEELDNAGQPLRWQEPQNLLAWYGRPRAVLPAPEETQTGEKSEKPKIVRYPRGAGHYREIVENFARRYNLSTALVMAIIHSESDFSPSLVSSKSAMGLMQLLPSTASGEVHRFLYGRRGQVSFEQLSVPEINIRYGTAYLHILLNRYFQNVSDENVREACAIASYNLGPNRFLRLYGRTNEQAVACINSMNAEEFYSDLATRLPSRETRYYVEKVRRMKRHYSPQ